MTEDVDEGPTDKVFGFKYTLSRNVQGSQDEHYSPQALLQGGTFISSGHGISDYFEVRLEGGPQYVRKIVLGFPVRKDQTADWGISRLNGAVV